MGKMYCADCLLVRYGQENDDDDELKYLSNFPIRHIHDTVKGNKLHSTLVTFNELKALLTSQTMMSKLIRYPF